MKCSILCVGVFSLCSLFLCTNNKICPPSGLTPTPPVISIAELEPQLHQREVTIKFTVSKLEGVSQLAIPGKAPTFIIEAESDDEKKDLSLWIEGELADVLDRLQLSNSGTDPIQKGTIIVATGSLEFSPGAGDRVGHEWYSLTVEKWQNFRIVAPDVSSGETAKPTE